MYVATAIIATAALCSLGTGHLQAQLPTLKEDPWHGYFAGQSTKQGMLGIMSDGSITYNDSHKIYPSVQERSSDGKVTIHRLMPETLESNGQPSAKPEKITYTGKVKNGATIEVIVEFTKNEVSIGGAMTSKGKGAREQSFVLFTKAPAYYMMYGEPLTMKEGSPEEKKKLEKVIARQKAIAAKEFLELRRLDGKQIKQPLLDSVDFSEKFNGDGFISIKAELDCFKGRKMDIGATGDSRLMLSNKESQPIFKHHYYITWMASSKKKSASEGRMVLQMR